MLAPSAGFAQEGPSGGTGGGAFTDPQDPFRAARVTIRSGAFVDSVQLTHEQPNGALVTFPHHGGFGGGEQNLDLAANEHITRIDGRLVHLLTTSTSIQTMVVCCQAEDPAESWIMYIAPRR